MKFEGVMRLKKRVRDEALEEAAKVADGAARELQDAILDCGCWASIDRAAEKIRALKEGK